MPQEVINAMKIRGRIFLRDEEVLLDLAADFSLIPEGNPNRQLIKFKLKFWLTREGVVMMAVVWDDQAPSNQVTVLVCQDRRDAKYFQRRGVGVEISNYPPDSVICRSGDVRAPSAQLLTLSCSNGTFVVAEGKFP